jgi:hypothetical protein
VIFLSLGRAVLWPLGLSRFWDRTFGFTAPRDPSVSVRATNALRRIEGGASSFLVKLFVSIPAQAVLSYCGEVLQASRCTVGVTAGVAATAMSPSETVVEGNQGGENPGTAVKRRSK